MFSTQVKYEYRSSKFALSNGNLLDAESNGYSNQEIQKERVLLTF